MADERLKRIDAEITKFWHDLVKKEKVTPDETLIAGQALITKATLYKMAMSIKPDDEEAEPFEEMF